MGVNLFLADLINVLARTLEFLFLARIIMSWIFRGQAPGGVGGRLFGVIFSLTEPILAPIRNLLLKSSVKSVCRVIDFSPILGMALVRGAAIILTELALLITM